MNALARTAAAADDGTAVYTYGWDTAFAIPVPDVNKAIVDHGSSPPSFQWTDPYYVLSGDFGDWQICQGGDGKTVRMILPLSNVTMLYTHTGHSNSFPTGSVVVEIELHYVPHDVGAAGARDDPAAGKPMALKAKPTSDDPNQPVFNVVELTLDPVPGTVTGALINQGIANWGTANLAEFAHVFAVVDINRIVGTGEWAFVLPNYTSYCYLDKDTLEDSIFGVLTMTGDRGPGSNTEQINPAAIPPGSIAGFLVSNDRALLDLVRPAIIGAYPGLTESNFLLNDQHELYLTDGSSVDLTPVTHDGSTYQPKLTSLSIQSLDQIFTLTSYTETDIAAGITAWCQTVHQYTIQLGSSANGQTLNFTTVGTPDITHGISQSPGSQLTQLIIDIVAAVALLILGVLTDGAAFVVGGLVIGLLMGLDNVVPALIKLCNSDDSPAIDLLLVNSVDPITWTGSQTFKLQYGSMNASLQLGGDPLFV